MNRVSIGRSVRTAVALTLVAGLSLVSACGDASSNAKPSNEIRISWAGSDTVNTAVNAALDDFEKKDGIKSLREAQDWSGYWDKLATQVAAKNAPDVIYQVASQIPNYSTKNALVDLNTMDIDLSNMDEGVKSFGEADGKLWGIVSAANAYTLIVNPAILEKAGVTIPDGDYSWNDLAQFATQAAEGTDGGWGLNDGGGDFTLFVLWVRSRGRELYTDDGKLNATKEDVSEWFKYWDDLRKAGAVPPADVTSEGASAATSNPFVQGKSAMTFGWTQDFTNNQALMKQEIDPKLPPNDTKNPGLWMNAASMWSISSTSKNKENAAKAIDFLINDETAVKDQGLALGIPPTQKARDAVKTNASDADKKIIDYMDTVAKVSKPLNRLWPEGFPQLRTKFSELNEAVAFGTTSINQATEDLFAEAANY